MSRAKDAENELLEKKVNDLEQEILITRLETIETKQADEYLQQEIDRLKKENYRLSNKSPNQLDGNYCGCKDDIDNIKQDVSDIKKLLLDGKSRSLCNSTSESNVHTNSIVPYSSTSTDLDDTIHMQSDTSSSAGDENSSVIPDTSVTDIDNSNVIQIEDAITDAIEENRVLNGKFTDAIDENRMLNEDRVFLRTENNKLRNEMKQFRREFCEFKTQSEKEIISLKQKMTVKKGSKDPLQTTLETSNRFRSLRYESNNPQQPEVSPDEVGRTIPADIGTSTAGKKALLITTSMSRDIVDEDFNNKYPHGNAKFKRYRGGKVKTMKEFLPAKLEEEKSDIIIFQGGGNDLPSTIKKNEPVPVSTIANHIISAARICARTGAKVCVSSVLPRQDFHMQLKRKELNDILRGLCARDGYMFIENNNIVLSQHILPDGVHLNDKGTELFSMNLLNALHNV